MSKTKKKNSNYNYGKTYTEAELKAQEKAKAEKKKLGRRINSAKRMGTTAPPLRVKRKRDWVTYTTTALLLLIIGLGALILLGKEPLISTTLKNTLSYVNFVLVGLLYMLFGYRKHKDTGDIKKGYIFYGLGLALVVYSIVVYVVQVMK